MSKMNYLKKMILICSLLTMTACGASNSDATETQKANPITEDNVISDESVSSDEKIVISSVSGDVDTSIQSKFAIDLFKEACLSDIDKNINTFISPDSVMTAMGMCANGANKQTFDEINAVLLKDMTLDDFNSMINTNNMAANNLQAVKFNSANSVWVNKNIIDTLRPSFEQTLKESYNAEIEMTPFNMSTPTTINEWVSKNTQGMIPEIVKELPNDAAMYLINAVAFDAEWQTPYTDINIHEHGIFTDENGKDKECVMLCSTENSYFESKDAIAVIKPYTEQYSFMGILPKTSVSQYVSDMDISTWTELIHSEINVPVETQIPEFTCIYDITLSDALQKMGIKEAFTDKADFSKMIPPEKKNEISLSIGEVYHKAFIDVNRKGTKAAAATAIEMTVNSIEEKPVETKQVYLNKPFVYAIVDNITKRPIFIGTVLHV